MMVLEASASNTRDATFKVPVARLRSLRDQIQALFGLPDTNALCEWTHLYEDVSEVLTAVEVKCAQRPGAEDAEVQILRLKSLLSVVMQWPRYWQHWDDDDYLKVRCGRYALERWTRQPEEEETLSAAEKYRAVADHLQAMRNIRELPGISALSSGLRFDEGVRTVVRVLTAFVRDCPRGVTQRAFVRGKELSAERKVFHGILFNICRACSVIVRVCPRQAAWACVRS